MYVCMYVYSTSIPRGDPGAVEYVCTVLNSYMYVLGLYETGINVVESHLPAGGKGGALTMIG